MLFKFGIFWQAAAIVLGSWVFYGIWDFEFAAITLLALILALKLQNQ
jgi:hypothetical protein